MSPPLVDSNFAGSEMKLYQNQLSPFARKTLIVVQETGQQDDVESIEVFGTTLEPGTIPVAQNPLGKLPVLVRPDGPAIYDSRVICRYLDDRAGTDLYPSGSGEWDCLTLEATADGIMDSAVLMIYEARIRPPEFQYQPVVEAHWAKVSRAITALNDRWVSHLQGSLHIGQIAVACALGYVDFRLADRGWRDDNPALAEWFAGFGERESFRTTIPKA